MNNIIALSFISNSIGYALYYFQMKRGDSEPKLVSWGLWSFLSIFNFLSYREMTDFYLSFIFFADAVFCAVIFSFAYFKKHVNVWSIEDYEVLGLGALSILVWWQWKEASYANLIICICYFVSFYPTVKQVWKNPNTENPVSWYVCTFAYGLNIWNLVLEKDRDEWNYLAPATLFILHLAVAIRAKKKEIFESPVD